MKEERDETKKSKDVEANEIKDTFHQHVVIISPRLTIPFFRGIIKTTYKECARDKLDDRTATCREVRC